MLLSGHAGRSVLVLNINTTDGIYEIVGMRAFLHVINLKKVGVKLASKFECSILPIVLSPIRSMLFTETDVPILASSLPRYVYLLLVWERESSK